MKKSLITFIFLYVCVTYSVNSQCTNIFPINGYTGIQTNNPQRPLNIHGDTLCSEVTERLSYGNVLFPDNLGHLALLTPATINSYTLCLNRGLGDVVIESGLGQNNGGNVILSTKDPEKKIIMALTPITGYPELERLKIFSDGKSEFNIGS